MAKTFVGLDIGNSTLKIAIRRGETVNTLSFSLPENLVTSGRIQMSKIFADFIHSVWKENRLPRNCECALILPDSLGICRKMTFPYISVAQLKLNLPYEFRDYIVGDSEQYFYDYAVLRVEEDEDAKPSGLEIMAAAVPKEIVQEFDDILKLSGLKLRCIFPREMLYKSVLESFVAKNPEEENREVCFVDIGYGNTVVHVYKGTEFISSRVIDIGCADIDGAIAEHFGIDKYLAGTFKNNNSQDCLALPECADVYSHISVEIMKVINFYRFNNREADLDTVYYVGGGAAIPTLCNAINDTIDLKQHTVDELFDDVIPQADLCFLAIGMAKGGIF